MINQSQKILTSGDLFYSTDYDQALAVVASLGNTNMVSVKESLDAFQYSSFGHINDFEIKHALTNEQIIRAGNCGVGELERSTDRESTMSFTRLDVRNVPLLGKILGITVTNVPSTPITDTNHILRATGTRAIGESIKIPAINGDGTAPTIGAIKN